MVSFVAISAVLIVLLGIGQTYLLALLAVLTYLYPFQCFFILLVLAIIEVKGPKMRRSMARRYRNWRKHR